MIILLSFLFEFIVDREADLSNKEVLFEITKMQQSMQKSMQYGFNTIAEPLGKVLLYYINSITFSMHVMCCHFRERQEERKIERYLE